MICMSVPIAVYMSSTLDTVLGFLPIGGRASGLRSGYGFQVAQTGLSIVRASCSAYSSIVLLVSTPKP